VDAAAICAPPRSNATAFMIDVPAPIPMITSRMNSASFDDHPLQPSWRATHYHFARVPGKLASECSQNHRHLFRCNFWHVSQKIPPQSKPALGGLYQGNAMESLRGDAGFIDLQPLP